MNRTGNRFPPFLSSALIFLAAAVVHVLFFTVFRPVHAQNRVRPQKRRYTVMYSGGKNDPLKLAYWFRLDSGSPAYGRTAGKGYSVLIRPEGFSPERLDREDLREKRIPLFGTPLMRNGGELALPEFPPAFPLPSSEQGTSSAGTGRFTDLSGKPVPGFSAGISSSCGSGTAVLASEPDPSGMLPPQVRIVWSTGNATFDRSARKLFAENLLALPEEERKQGYTAVFECGRDKSGKGPAK